MRESWYVEFLVEHFGYSVEDARRKEIERPASE
jgi:hypothetical protein